MVRKKTVPDSVTASLDYDLAVILATHVDQSDEYDSRADFVREALWDKLCEEYESSDVLEEYISRQERRVDELKRDAEYTIGEYEKEVDRLREAQKEFDQTVENEAEELFEQLDDAEYGTK